VVALEYEKQLAVAAKDRRRLSNANKEKIPYSEKGQARDLAAKERRIATLKRGKKKPVPAKVPEREKGEARNKAAEMVG
jgi:hypothetical protein